MSMQPSESNPAASSSQPSNEPEKKTKSPKAPTAKFGSPKHCVDVTLAVASSKGLPLTILAKTSGASDESVATVALAVITNFTRAKSMLSTALEIINAEPMESGILATMCSNEDATLFKSVWSLATVLSPAMPSQVPAAKAKAGLELAKGLQSLTEEARGALRKAGNVLS